MCSFPLCLHISAPPPPSVQVRWQGTTTPPSSQVVRWWTSAVMSSSSTSARRRWATRGRGQMTLLETLSRSRPMRQLCSSRAAWRHQGTPLPTTSHRMAPCRYRKWWMSGLGGSEKWQIAVFDSYKTITPVTSFSSPGSDGQIIKLLGRGQLSFFQLHSSAMFS